MSAVDITLGSKTIASLEAGETYTFSYAGKVLSFTNNLSITFNSAGYYTYAGITTIGKDGKTKRLICAGKMLATDIVIVAGEYSSGSSPLPIEVESEEEMTSILTNATASMVGAVYKYVGETTTTYTKGALYVIDMDSNSGGGNDGVYT